MSPSIWWAALGVALIAVEMATGTFFVLWFGVAALLTAGFSLLGSFFPFAEEPISQYVFFAVSSVLLLLLTRRWASRFSGPSDRSANMDGLIGASGIVEELIDAKRGIGLAKVHGEVWRVETTDGVPLKMGVSVKIQSVEGNKLKVRIENGRPA